MPEKSSTHEKRVPRFTRDKEVIKLIEMICSDRKRYDTSASYKLSATIVSRLIYANGKKERDLIYLSLIWAKECYQLESLAEKSPPAFGNRFLSLLGEVSLSDALTQVPTGHRVQGMLDYRRGALWNVFMYSLVLLKHDISVTELTRTPDKSQADVKFAMDKMFAPNRSGQKAIESDLSKHSCIMPLVFGVFFGLYYKDHLFDCYPKDANLLSYRDDCYINIKLIEKHLPTIIKFTNWFEEKAINFNQRYIFSGIGCPRDFETKAEDVIPESWQDAVWKSINNLPTVPIASLKLSANQ